MRKEKNAGRIDLSSGVIAESKLVTLKHLDFMRHLNKTEIQKVREKHVVDKSASYDVRRKDIVTKHVSLNKTNAEEAAGVEQALKA